MRYSLLCHSLFLHDITEKCEETSNLFWVICINFLQLELYFAGDDDIGPFSARNELESLNLLFKIMNSLLPTSNVVAKEVLQRLQDEIVVRLTSIGQTEDAQMIVRTQNNDAEDSLLKWGEHHGVKSKLQIACKSLLEMRIHLICHPPKTENFLFLVREWSLFLKKEVCNG